MRRYIVFICVSLLPVCFVHAHIRVVNYNINSGVVRTGLDTVLEAIGNENYNGMQRPVDIWLFQEMQSSSPGNIANILNNIYNGDTDVFYDDVSLVGSSTGGGLPGMVYNTVTCEFIGQSIVNYPSSDGAARSTIRYKFRPVGYSSQDAVFYVYNSHFKASQGSDNEDRRAEETREIRVNSDALGDGVNIIYAGDFNLYTSSEQAWSNLTASGGGRAFDPPDKAGSWHNNSAYMAWHTQSPSNYPPSPLVGGGMDDRFDFQLVSGEMLDGEGIDYIQNSYHTFANNGSHYWNGGNGNISTGDGASSEVLNLLENVSDHLPVVADYQVPSVMGASVADIPPPAIICEGYQIEVLVENAADVVYTAGADELVYTIESDIVQASDPCVINWQDTDIGSPSLAGSYTYNAENEEINVSGSGVVGFTSEKLYYVYIPLVGDGEMVYNLTNMNASSPGGGAGLMVRETTDAGARYGFIYLNNEGNILWRYRSTEGSFSPAVSGPTHSGSRYLKISRAGDVLTGYESFDGTNWNEVSSVTLNALSNDVKVGLAVCSGDDSTYCQANFQGESSGGSGDSGNSIGPFTAEPLAGVNSHFLTIGQQESGSHAAMVTVNAASQATEDPVYSKTVNYRFTELSDFDGDFDFDIEDINLMLGAVGTANALFDIDNNGSVDQQDIDMLIHDVYETGYGDFDLDGMVGVPELDNFLDNWLDESAGWQQGEMTGDGKVNLEDFSLLLKDWLFGL